MEQIKVINLENISDEEAKNFKERIAARAIVYDKDGLVALLYATKNFYYKLPCGGGLSRMKQMSWRCKESA